MELIVEREDWMRSVFRSKRRLGSSYLASRVSAGLIASTLEALEQLSSLVHVRYRPHEMLVDNLATSTPPASSYCSFA